MNRPLTLIILKNQQKFRWQGNTLPFITESQTRNVEMIKTINRLEHGVSYPKLPAIKITFTIQKLAETEPPITHPAETQSHQQTILVCDNTDCLEETFSGCGIIFKVNGIAIQRAFFGPLLNSNRVKIEKSKKQSIKALLDNIYVYKAGRKTDTPQSV